MNTRRSVLVQAGVALAVLVVGSACGEQPTTTTPGDGARDATRVYVVNNHGTTLSVIDHDQRAVVAEVELGAQPHGQIPSPDGKWVYATTEDSGEVVAVATLDDTVAWRAKLSDTELHQPSVTRDGRFVFVPDAFAGRIAVLDTGTRAAAGELPMLDGEGGQPLNVLHNTYLSSDGRWLFATAIFSHKIAKIDVESQTVARLYDVAGEPRPAALRRDLSTAYVQISSLMGFVAIDLDSGAETARVELPDDGSQPAGWDNWTHSHGIALTPDDSELWAATLAGKVYVFSVPELEQLAVVDIGVMPNWLAFTEDGATLYVTNTTAAEPNGTVSVIDVAARRVSDTITVGAAPKRIHVVRVPGERR